MAPPLDRVPWVLDLVDVDSQKWQEMADRGRFPMNLVHGREARTLRAFESRALLSARAGLVINEREARLARAIAPQAAIEIVSNGVDVEGFRRPDDTAGSAANVVFCGVMNYSPNEEGVLWFVREVWPAVRRARPDATLTLVGANPTDRIKAAAAHDRGILVTGSVGDVRSALWRAAVAIAPIHVARGMQNKVLEAIAASLPVAVTPAVAEGLPSSVLPACVVAATEPDFAQAVLALLDMPEEARRARAARAPIATLSWDAALTPLRAILERAADGEQALSES
jgi:glycosyltransferase involved in cell wall biosynthesis